MIKAKTRPDTTRHALIGTLLAVSLVAAVLLSAGTALAVGQVGEPAADFNLQDTGGTFHSPNDYLGQVLLIFMMGYG